MKKVYYNEFDPKAAEWLRELIRGGHIADGVVDERSILLVRPEDLGGYSQCHFFAGIGGWSYALRLAGVPDDYPVWTGSCPCQPLSSAGKQLGHADERHLWPAFHDLIDKRRPAKVIGEQVASADGREWFAGVRADMEGMGYACGGADLCAAGVGSPNIRQRLYWLADSQNDGRQGRDGFQGAIEQKQFERQGSVVSVGVGHPDGGGQQGERKPKFAGERSASGDQPDGRSELGRLADTDGRDTGTEGLQRSGRHGQRTEDDGADRMGHAFQSRLEGQRGNVDDRDQPGRINPDETRPVAQAGASRGVANAQHDDGRTDEPRRGSEGREADGGPCERSASAGGLGDAERSGLDGQYGRGTGDQFADAGFWSRYDLLPCTDGKARRIEPGTFPLAHGVSGRVGLLRGYGNAINPWQAALFIKAALTT